MFDDSFLREHMQTCIDLAIKTRNLLKPHVGAVLVSSNGKVIGKGYRRFIDDKSHMKVHAERDAINNTTGDLKGSTLFTILEPCIMQLGRSSKNTSILKPCSKLIIEEEIGTVVYAIVDPAMNGQGLNFLRNRGVEVFNYSGLNNEILHQLMDKRTRSAYNILF